MKNVKWIPNYMLISSVVGDPSCWVTKTKAGPAVSIFHQLKMTAGNFHWEKEIELFVFLHDISCIRKADCF